jgi:hypothetical protein
MVRPELRIIEPQQEETRIVDASQSERDFLLAKYGYKTIDHPQNDFTEQNNLSNLSFEEMISLDDSRRTLLIGSRYVVMPVVAEWGYVVPKGEAMPENKAYKSDTNDLWMSEEDIRNYLKLV